MLLNILIAIVVIAVVTVIHAGGMMLAIHLMRKDKGFLKLRLQQTHIYQICAIVLLMFYVSLVEVLLWAGVYLWLDAIDGLEKAVYFSMVTFTTLGYGEIVLDERYRLLASFEAANGIIMFGWTTAIVLAAVQRIYFKEKNTTKGV